MKPLLFRFKVLCNSSLKIIPHAEFSEENDMLLVSSGNELVTTIKDKTQFLGTKKENLEKGEDESPSLFWK